MKKLTYLILSLAFLITCINPLYSKYWWYSFKWDNNIEIYDQWHDIAKLNEGTALLFFGTFTDNKNYTYVIDLKNRQSTKIDADTAPSVTERFRISHIADGKVILFGGQYLNSESLYETWIFDSKEMKWTNMRPKNHPWHSDSLNMCYLSDGKVLLMLSKVVQLDQPGSYTTGVESWVYDLKKNDWEQLKSDSAPKVDYDWYISYIDENKVLCVQFYDYIKTVYTSIFDYTKNSWTKLHPVHIPPQKRYGDLALIDTGKVLLFAGVDPLWTDDNDTSYVFDLKTNDWSASRQQPNPYDSAFKVYSACKYDQISLNNIVLPRKNRIWVFTTDSLSTMVDTTQPGILSTYPLSEQSDTPLDAIIKIEFSEEMDSTSFNSENFKLEHNQSPLNGRIHFDKRYVSFIPDDSLLPKQSYWFTVDSVTDKFGNLLYNRGSFGFTTYKTASVENNDNIDLLTPLYPNPSGGGIIIPLYASDCTKMEVFDVKGLKIDEKELNSSDSQSSITYDAGNLASGTYFIRIQVGKQLKTYMFIKK